jgi:uncharacterized integral membrane protein (TIGR00697 family)
MHAPSRTYRYYDLIMVAFVTVLICSNFISAPKRVGVGPFVFGAGVIFFPLSYLFGDILTEVYGYARSRKVIWAGFGALVFTSLLSWVVLALPPDPTWPHQQAWQTVFGNSPRIVAASMVAYFAGEFVNSFTLAKMKILTRGRWLWTRTIGSTVAGEVVDTAIFYPLAFYGVDGWPVDRLLLVMATNYCLKVANEIIMTPITYRVVAYLKRVENEDYYDYDTDFNPFSLEVNEPSRVQKDL